MRLPNLFTFPYKRGSLLHSRSNSNAIGTTPNTKDAAATQTFSAKEYPFEDPGIKSTKVNQLSINLS
jgi:hypothetical protein